MDNLPVDLLRMIGKDDLKGVLKRLSEVYSKHQEHQNLLVRTTAELGRLTRIEQDRLNGLISINDFYVNLNQIRSSILYLIEETDRREPDILPYAPDIINFLKDDVRESNRLIEQNKWFDSIYKVFLFAVLLSGFGALLYTFSVDQELEDKIYLGSISTIGIFTSMYFYTRLRGIEILRYGKK
ncbi:MAG: hypothetical protein AAF806_20870 [Bacteroidota bacterium]